MEERLQKYMARCGVDSRRKCEELIANGMVEVNGHIIREPGVKIDPMRDRVRVDGRELKTEKLAYYLHYKVKGVTTTVSDDLGRKTVMDCLPNLKERVYPVGRLDRESEGLLVLTNDGALANFLTHPAFGIAKTYRVVAEGRVPEETLRELSEKGMRLGPVLVKPAHVELVRYDNDNTIVMISVSEGVNREVRRIFAALGHEVKKLLRVQTGPLVLAGLKRGQTRPLTPKELNILKKLMAGANTDPQELEKMFPHGSAAGRKPTGPRGRPKKQAAPRHGKPDPASNREFSADKKKRLAKIRTKEEDWPTMPGKGRKSKPAAKRSGEKPTARPSRSASPAPARNAKPTRSAKPAAKRKPAAKPRPTRMAAHPLMQQKNDKGKRK